MTEVIEAERQKVLNLCQEDSIFRATSYSLAMLSFHSSALRNLGMKEVAIKVLKDALSQARKGVV